MTRHPIYEWYGEISTTTERVCCVCWDRGEQAVIPAGASHWYAEGGISGVSAYHLRHIVKDSPGGYYWHVATAAEEAAR